MIQLPRQLAQRIRAWNNELPRHQYTPIGPVAFEGFTTLDRIPAAQAADMPRRPFPVGTPWGACWEYAWFSGEITLPVSCRGQRVVFFSGLGGEQLVYVNGKAAGSIDREHHYVTLTRCAEGGETFRLLIESYAGHGERIENLGPVPPERKAIPPVPEAQCRVAESFIAVWNEDAYQLLMDVNTLSQLLEILPDKSLRAQKVAKALADYTHVADFELPMEARHESFRRAREVLRPALECHNGSTAPTMWLIANSHIDLAWLWPAEETFHKSARTYANQLALMEEYPEYRFLLCEPALLEMLKAFSDRLPEGVTLTQLTYKRGEGIRVSAEAAQPTDAYAFKDALAKAERERVASDGDEADDDEEGERMFADVILSEVKQSRGGVNKFDVEAKFEKEEDEAPAGGSKKGGR